MEKVTIKKTEYVSIPRENIIEFLVNEGILEGVGEGYFRVTGGGQFSIKGVRKWAYFPLLDELDNSKI
jgi:hypothetical protein